MSDLKIGIIGAGNIGSRQARFWSQIEGATVVAITDRDADTAAKLAQSLPGSSVSSSTEELLANPDINVVHVCVPTHLHRDIVLAAAKAGKHILCEKPMALSLADCDAMIQSANDAGVLLSVGHVVRFFPDYAQGKQVAASGRIGTPAIVRTRRAGIYPKAAWFADAEQSGGVITDLVVHDLDWLLWCFGPIQRVFARTAKASGLEYALLTLRHTSGVISHAEGIWGEPGGFHAAFEIAGDAGMLAHDSRRSRALVAAPRPGATTAVNLMAAPLAAQDDPYYRQLVAFAKAVRGTAPLAVNAHDARAAVEVALAALESIRTGKTIEISIELSEAAHA